MWELPEVSNWILLTSVLQQVRGGMHLKRSCHTSHIYVPQTAPDIPAHDVQDGLGRCFSPTQVSRTANLRKLARIRCLYRDPPPPPPTHTQVSRTANLRKLARIRSLYRDRRRRCFLFDDLHCVFTSGPAAAPWERWGERRGRAE